MGRGLIDAGADIDRIQRDGLTLGARLDVRDQHGVSLDYFLKEWQESVYGVHPEGWHKVREAIAKRRGAVR